jgi:hypothetical protein
MSNEHLAMLSKECSDTPTSEFAKACRLWANNTLLDDVIVPKDYEFRGNDNHTNLKQETSNHQLKALGGYRLAPLTRTMFVNSYAVCSMHVVVQDLMYCSILLHRTVLGKLLPKHLLILQLALNHGQAEASISGIHGMITCTTI